MNPSPSQVPSSSTQVHTYKQFHPYARVAKQALSHGIALVVVNVMFSSNVKLSQCVKKETRGAWQVKMPMASRSLTYTPA